MSKETHMVEETCAIIKPDAVQNHATGKIIDIIEKKGFDIVRLEKKTLSRAEAEKFYAVHNSRPFFGELVDFITSGPIVAMVLRKENAIAEWRTLMGDTNPATAAEGTLRKQFGTDIGQNATHGSDSASNAATEIKLLFS
jgi:nucleoside-diphosphate kinase